MANTIVQLFNSKLNTELAMSAKEAVKTVLNYSNTPLDQDDKAKIAVGCFEDINREDGSEILKLYDLNSDVNCAIVAFLNNDTFDTRDKLCEAIKKSFISYFSEDIKASVNDAIADKYRAVAEEHDVYF